MYLDIIIPTYSVTLKYTVPFSLFPAVNILILILHVHAQIDFVDFEKHRAFIIPSVVWLSHNQNNNATFLRWLSITLHDWTAAKMLLTDFYEYSF